MDNSNLVQLVENARGGCRESLGQLSIQIQDELYRYIYRLTLDADLANDIRQETLLQMCRTLCNLREADRFKPWLYKTAWGKVKNHYRSNKKKRHMSLNDSNNLIDALQSNCTEGLKALVSSEIAETMVRSMWTLDVKQRSVLVLRCYENLSYREIASIINCSETTARVLFFRAKNSLKAKLRKKGIVTQPMFLGMLGLFGTVTSSAEAAVTVSASTLKVGALGTTIGYLLGKVGSYLISLIAGVGVLAGGAALMNTSHEDPFVHQNTKTEIKSFHFIEQAWDKSYMPNANLLMGQSLSRGGYEKWFFFPEDVDGPMFLMTQRWDPQIKNKLCGWLLNGDGQHYYHSGQKTIYLFNSPLPKQRTLRFPSDNVEFAEFLDKMEGSQEGVEYSRDAETGLLVELHDNRFSNAKDFSSDISYNILDEKTFDSFRYKWPKDAKFNDERDDIHKQGWTSFKIDGTINNTAIHGVGRIPFVYNTSKEYPPLLKLQVGNRTLIDCPAGAYVLNENEKAIASYPTGSFFKGLMRPWYGIHTIDSLRRDAAGQRIPFRLENVKFDLNIYNYRKRIVTLHNAPGYPNLTISVSVNIAKNEIAAIDFATADNISIGQLEFTYPTSTATMIDITDMPTIKKPWSVKEQLLETLWLFKLTGEAFGEH